MTIEITIVISLVISVFIIMTGTTISVKSKYFKFYIGEKPNDF